MTKECECAAHSAAECCCGAWDEPVIDKTAAIRIATVLGWEPKREWVGLTTEDILNLGAHIVDFKYAEAIEAKLKEKNSQC